MASSRHVREGAFFILANYYSPFFMPGRVGGELEFAPYPIRT